MACGGAIDVTMSSRGHIGGEPFEYVLYAEPDEPRLQSLRAAMTLAVDVLQANGPWLRLARAYVMTDAAGDGLYVPPAWLLDLDEHDRGTARRWRLMRGTLTEPASGHEFEHAWIEGHGLVVSVSNLRNGYPAYCMTRATYYARNGVRGVPLGLSARSLRVVARQRGLSPDLARWLHARGFSPECARACREAAAG